jgi:DNA ligase 1
MIKNVLEIIKEIAAHPSTKDKEKLIQKYMGGIFGALFKKVVLFALDPFMMYNIRSIKYIEECVSAPNENYDIIFNYLEYLSKKRGASNNERHALSVMASVHGRECVDIVNLILKKDLRCGASGKTFKKYVAELPEFGVMLCGNEMRHFFRIVKNDPKNILWSPKLDGVRTITHTFPVQSIVYFSRKGLEFDFHILDPYLKKLIIRFVEKFNFMPKFDGEVITSEKRFQKLMTQLKKLEDADRSSFQYHIFDIILDDTPLIDRLNILHELMPEGHIDDKIFMVPHITMEKIDDVEKIVKECLDSGFEGAVFKDANSMYQYKRCHHWTKVKPVKSIDIPIIGHFEGNGKYQGMMGGIIVNVNGVSVNVGSGFDDPDREIGYEKRFPIGTLAEIEFQDYTEDKSLRNPIFIRLRDDK